ncbi:hypothetical protein RJ639_003940 [Escallonia herrerae]|uniref:Uncharacterized protein n=1 Tax=Escallonia herrerae TaxID=1293975 RepID=A0AA88W213_9ASTE|nr:hypothetical protein RJ639_003940 [Escallonia herrerae]
MLATKKLRPICENDIVLGETFFNGCWRRHDKHRPGTESKGENWTIFVRKLFQHSVDRFFYQVEMAYYWIRRKIVERRRRKEDTEIK